MIAAMSPPSRPSIPIPERGRLHPRRRVGSVLRGALLVVVFAAVAVQIASPAEKRSAAARAEAGSTAAVRLVSLNPSLTAMLVRLGAGDRLVGIDDYSAQVVPELADRPRVGGLFAPNLEAVLALRPDRVLLVAGVEQERQGEALRKLGLVVEVFENERYEQVIENLVRLGRMTGSDASAQARIGEIRSVRAAVERAVRGRPRPSTVIVLDRSPLYVVGGETFLDELLAAVGAENLGARLAKGYPRASLEWLVASRPELLLDLSPQLEAEQRATSPGRPLSSVAALAFWSRWPSLPAVRAKRVVALDATRVSLPGPELDRALRELAIAVHGPAIEAAIREARGGRAAP